MSDVKKIFEKQFLHLAGLLGVLGLLGLLGRIEGFLEGSLGGISTWTWFLITVSQIFVHQFYVWFCWRTELYLGLIQRWLGKHAFGYYAVLFFILVILRLVLISCLAISNQNTIPISDLLSKGLSILLAIPALYTLYSVGRYFTFKRAAGLDHFDPNFRNAPLVKKGIFRYTNNGMYQYGLLMLWIPGIYFTSVTAISVALFSHLYIWVHFYSVEKPDMRFIYGGKSSS